MVLPSDHDDFESPEEDAETDYLIDPISKKNESIMYGLYSQLSNQELHFNKLQAINKILASTWLLASFIAIGFIYTKSTLSLPISKIFIEILIIMAGVCGITMLWLLDLMLYQKLWLSAVLELAKLEEQYSWLPKIRSHIIKNQNHTSHKFFQSTFYICCNIIYFILFSISVVMHMDFNIVYIIITAIVMLLVSILLIFGMLLLSGELNKISIRKQNYKKK